MRYARPAFTLVEILIVVLLLGILAAIAIPNITNFPRVARESNLKENISKIRAHIQVYRNQHAAFPEAGFFGDQLTKYTNFSGDVSDVRTVEHRFGPYIEQMPPNPVTRLATIRPAGGPDEHLPPGDADGGWWYNEVTGQFHADLADSYVDDEGEQYNHY